ncbi:MAG TPA: AMP-dependent synthetase/ligase [Mycobacteriales bacterium]|nr:AMP-dependent synthetase/ligase [Mycobacteriales bacterium]
MPAQPTAEFSVPAGFDLAHDANLTDGVFGNASDYPDTVVFDRKVDGAWQPVTAKNFAEEVKALAAGLIASGVGAGDRVALMSATRYEWTLIDYAIWTAGAVTVPIYETSSAEQIEWILSDSGAVAFFYETDAHKAAYDEVSGKVGSVSNVWQIDEAALDAIITAGKAVGEDDIEQRRRTLGLDSLATIIYTSGTTGRPKGCELTHRNFLFDSTSTTDGLDELFGPDQSTLLFLPLAHVFARIIQVGCVQNRVRMGHTADIKNLLADFAAFKPTFILSVPRVFEKVYNQAKQKAHADGKGAIFDLAERVAISYSQALDGNPLQRIALEAPHRLFDALVYSKLRAALGGRVQAAISGGAPLGARLGHFYRGIGVPIYEGYGLTETTAGATVNRPDAMKVGTVGRPIPGVTVRIADDGEILLQGDNVFVGYYNNPDATKEALESDRWFHTGDIGELDADGYLRITGRKKELIVTAGGKNVAPAVLEDRIRAHALISQCMVVGDQKPFIACLVTIDEEAWPDWKKSHGKPADATVADLVDDEDLRAEVQAAIDDANRAVSKAEAIKAFRIVTDDWTIETGHLTPSLKLKRNEVLKDHAADIDALYSAPKK